VTYPGTTENETRELALPESARAGGGERPIEGVQVFTPTARPTCMYHKAVNQTTGEPVHVPLTNAERLITQMDT